MLTKDFLQRFIYDPEKYLAVCIGSPEHATNFTFVRDGPSDFPKESDVYFGPALRSNASNKKEDVDGTIALWVDVDSEQAPMTTLPPSATVFSGHGWHLYWFLNAPLRDIDTIELLNKMLAKDVPDGDIGCWNANRVLRIPNTTNRKVPEQPVDVVIKTYEPLAYKPDDIRFLEKLDKATRHKIRTGDARGYRSRSERDWDIIVKLVACGASDEIITLIFTHKPCGDKVVESNPEYLPRTLEKARASNAAKAAVSDVMGQPLEEGSDGYYTVSRRGKKRVSTFVIHPTILLDGSAFGADDAIVGNVSASGYEWLEKTFSRGAFNSVLKMDKECPVAAWQWLDKDDTVRHLLPFLLAKLQENGLPRVSASPTLGLHFINGVPYFVGTKQVLSSTQTWNGFEGPIAWLPSRREHPETDLGVCNSLAEQIATVRDLVPRLNTPEAIWPMIGWYCASPLKPWIETQGMQFPILNVAGTKGSGKTSLIQRVFMPLLGQSSPKSYDASTTRFVMLAIMGSTNAIPVAFSEFRYGAAENLIRIILLAYDTGHDPRGRGDQTTVDYPLSAPFSVDGEDMVEDPAARERLIVALLHPDSIIEGTPYYEAFHGIRSNFPSGFGSYFVQFVLGKVVDGTAAALLASCKKEIFGLFPSNAPERIRNNHTVALLGCRLWCEAVGSEPISADVLRGSFTALYDLKTGRARTLIDAMIEDVINECITRGALEFKWVISPEGDKLYFQLTAAHSWWLASRRRQGRNALERDAIRSQLREAPYYCGTNQFRDIIMHGIDLAHAQQLGLDVPAKIQNREVTFHFA